jgi:hypothetical protein
MATTTPNFGWAVPTSTDLVKDGAVAIETLGDSIDASLVDLKGGTTGQVLAKASNTDMDFSWVAQDDSNAIQNSIVDAKGDLIAATANDTPARLAVGTNGQVLTADSTTATGLAWAAAASGGGMTLLASGSLSGSAINLTSISGSYVDLVLYVRNFRPANDNVGLCFRFNNDSNARYWMGGAVTGGSFSSSQMEMTSGTDNGASDGLSIFEIPDYANATTWKIITSKPATNNASTPTTVNYDSRNGVYNQTGAITQVNFFPFSGNFTSGSYALYGVK